MLRTTGTSYRTCSPPLRTLSSSARHLHRFLRAEPGRTPPWPTRLPGGGIALPGREGAGGTGQSSILDVEPLDRDLSLWPGRGTPIPTAGLVEHGCRPVPVLYVVERTVLAGKDLCDLEAQAAVWRGPADDPHVPPSGVLWVITFLWSGARSLACHEKPPRRSAFGVNRLISRLLVPLLSFVCS